MHLKLTDMVLWLKLIFKSLMYLFKLLDKAQSDGVVFGHLQLALLLVKDKCEMSGNEKKSCCHED